MAFSTAVRFGREGKWASGLGDDPERLADVEGDGRETLVGASGEKATSGLAPSGTNDAAARLRPGRLGRAAEPGVTSLTSEPKGFHRKGHPKADGGTSTLHAASGPKE